MIYPVDSAIQRLNRGLEIRIAGSSSLSPAMNGVKTQMYNKCIGRYQNLTKS